MNHQTISQQGVWHGLGMVLRASLRWPDWLWLSGCVPCLWLIGVVLGLEDAESLGPIYDPLASHVAAWGLAIGVGSIWMWRRWLIRNHPLRPAHDVPTDVLIVLGTLGALAAYLAIAPSHRVLPPNVSVCVLSGIAGLVLFHAAWTRRVGDTFHCSHCGYEIEDFSLPRRCPECEGVWAHRLIRGRVQRSTPLIAIATLLLFVLTLAPLPRLDSNSAFLRHLTPTAWILARAHERLQSAGTLESGWWRELILRRLSDSDADELREAILREHLAARLLDASAYAWLQGELFAGRGSDSQFRRFLNDALSPSVVVRGRGGAWTVTAQTGDLLTVAPQIEESRRLPRDRLAVYVEGIWKNDDQAPLIRSNQWELLSDLLSFDPRVPVDPDSVRVGTSIPTVRPGRLSLIGRYWVAVVPDGTPPTSLPREMRDAPPPGVAWIGEFEARRQVQISGPTPINEDKTSTPNSPSR